MQFVLLALSAAAGVSATPPATPARFMNPVPETCPRPAVSEARRSGTPLLMQKLGDLPGADALAAVWKTENGCTVPVITRSDIGGPAPRWVAPEPRARRTLTHR